MTDSTLLVFAALLTPVLAYSIGSIPFAYLIVRKVTGTDISSRGSGNVGAMNVRRSTGSWGWFTVAMISDALKGVVPVSLAKFSVLTLVSDKSAFFMPWSAGFEAVRNDIANLQNPLPLLAFLIPMLAVAASVMGHNYSCWMALIRRRFARTGKGLATGGGALLAYDWRYFVVALVIGLLIIAITRYMMAGQVAAAVTVPTAALLLQSPDWPFALFLGAVVYVAHHKRFVGLLKGKEPKLYVNDAMGPRG